MWARATTVVSVGTHGGGRVGRLTIAELKHLQRAVGWRGCPRLSGACPGVIGAGGVCGLECETPKEEVVGVSSELVTLHMKGALEGLSLTLSRKLLALGGTVPPGPVRPRMTSVRIQTIKSHG